MKENCPACGKLIRVIEGGLGEHHPPARLSWLKTKEDVCVGSGIDVDSLIANEAIERFCNDEISKLTENMHSYSDNKELLIIEIKYKAVEDPDVPVGKIWESHDVSEIIEKSLGAGVTNYYLQQSHDQESLVKIGSESALLAGGLERVIDQKKREYVRYLEKQIFAIGNFKKQLS